MEKRLLLAVLLISAVILVTNLLFPPEPLPEEAAGGADSAAVATAPAEGVVDAAPGLTAPTLPAVPAARADTVVVSSGLYRYAFSTRGAALVRADLLEYSSYTEEGPVQLVPEGTLDFLSHRVVVNGDTIDLRGLPFRVSGGPAELAEGDEPYELRFSYGEPGGFGAEIVYTFRPDRYLVGVRGRLQGLGGREATLLTELGPGLALHEAPAHHAERELDVVARVEGDVERLDLEDVEALQRLDGPMGWTAIRDKYFLAALVTGEGTPFTGVLLRDLPDVRQEIVDGDEVEVRTIPQAQLTAALPVGPDGAFAFDAYLGPQEYGLLSAIGYDLEEVTPYAYRWLQPLIRPIAAAILWLVTLMHDSLDVAYGWVLVLFGVMMRVVLWPLNAKAMRAQMKNMAVQPLMQEIREKYKDDPQRQQQEMVRLYKEEGFNPLAGCLPMLVPFPVLITLFFVFQNTIVFRGAEFLWIPDLSLADPWFILPVFLVVSMFALQFISARTSGMEQNPQMKMMMYFMPLMMGVLFFNLPAGLNLYYATTNVASIPQQVLIARERKKAKEEVEQNKGPKPKPAAVGRGRKKSRAKRK